MLLAQREWASNHDVRVEDVQQSAPADAFIAAMDAAGRKCGYMLRIHDEQAPRGFMLAVVCFLWVCMRACVRACVEQIDPCVFFAWSW